MGARRLLARPALRMADRAHQDSRVLTTLAHAGHRLEYWGTFPGQDRRAERAA